MTQRTLVVPQARRRRQYDLSGSGQSAPVTHYANRLPPMLARRLAV